MVQLLSDALIDLNELDEFLVQNLLFLLQFRNFLVELLQPLFEFLLVLKDGELVLLFNG